MNIGADGFEIEDAVIEEASQVGACSAESEEELVKAPASSVTPVLKVTRIFWTRRSLEGRAGIWPAIA